MEQGWEAAVTSMMKVIASHNGLKAVDEAWRQLQQGAAPLDACVEGVTLVEDDPDDLRAAEGGHG